MTDTPAINDEETAKAAAKAAQAERTRELVDQINQRLDALPLRREVTQQTKEALHPQPRVPNWEDHYFGVFPPAWRTRANNDPDFRDALLVNRELLKDIVRLEAFRLIFDPPARPIYQRGEIVGYEPRDNSVHVRWMLERLDPEEFHLASKVEMSGIGAPEAWKFEMGDRPLEIEAVGETEETTAG